MSRLWILEKVCSFWYRRPNVFVECRIKVVAVRNFSSTVGFSTITNEFLELGMGNLVRRHTRMEIVSFTVTFDEHTAIFSEISNKNLEHLEQKR